MTEITDLNCVAEVATPPLPQRSFVRSTSQLLAGSVVAQLLVAATFAVAARGLGRPVFGVVVALLGIGSVGQDLLDFGTSQWLSRELAAGRVTAAAAGALLRRRAALTVVGCAAVAAVAVAFFPLLPTLATATYVAAAVDNAGAHARMRAAGRFGRAAVHLVAERVSWLVMVVVVVAAKPDRSTAAAALVAAMAVAYVGSSQLAPRSPRPDTEAPGLRSAYRKSFSFGLLGLSTDLQQLDATAAAGFAGVGVAADVGIASKLTGPVGLAAAAVTQVAFRGVAAGGDGARRSAQVALRLSSALALAVAATSPVLPIAAVALLGSQYSSARTAIIVYAAGTAVAVLNQPLAGVLSAAGHDRIVSRLVGAAVIVGLVLGSLTVRSLGAAGMGVGFFVTQALICSSCVVIFRRRRL